MTPNEDRLAAFNQYAEDILQEAFSRWQRASQDGIQSTRAFLVTIVSRVCINHLQSARMQREEYVGQGLAEPVLTGAAADPVWMVRDDESLSMAFLVLLERLTPQERAMCDAPQLVANTIRDWHRAKAPRA
jgi:RNA polymerase sigma-70 factor (ECF subfamily)